MVVPATPPLEPPPFHWKATWRAYFPPLSAAAVFPPTGLVSSFSSRDTEKDGSDQGLVRVHLKVG